MNWKLKKSKFTYTEFLDYVINTDRVWGNSSENWSKSFTWTNNFKEAMDYARYGWDAWIEMLKDTDLIWVGWSLTTEFAIEWAVVDVARYLTGLPDCMVNFIDEIERDKPQITMYVPLGYWAIIDEENAQRYLKDALKIVYEKMEKFDVKVIWFFHNEQSGNILELTMVKLKDFWQQVVINNFAFAFHPSFFRRLWFRYIETKSYRDGGYWRPKEKYIADTLEQEKMINGKTWVFPEITNNWKCYENEIKKLG